jgi:hypothetical protein
MEIRRDYYDITPGLIYPKIKTTAIIKRNGFEGNFHDISPVALFRALLTNNIAETLFKVKQIELFKHFSSYYSFNSNLWPSIKICIRNNYIVQDASMWIDHIETLKDLGKDILNPKYICPENLKEAHSHYTKILRDVEKKKEFEEQKKKIDDEQKAYEQQKRKYFNLKISDENIEIVVLNHVREFLVEGEVLRHCVFANEYYKKKESLILSARKGSERLETIEVDLKKVAIVQCRGFQNSSTEYHENIVDLVTKNIPQIRKIKRSKEMVNCG